MSAVVCAAGRTAFLGGRWTEPCTEPLNDRIHVIGSPGLPSAEILLCDRHFAEANAAGYIDEPYIDRDEFERRRQA